MSAAKTAWEALGATLAGVEGVRYYRDYSASLDPPALLLGPPDVTWDTVCAAPTEATFIAYLVVQADDRAVTRLVDLLESVTDAVEATDFAAVTGAIGGTFPQGGADLPAYQITIEAALKRS